MWRPAGGTRGPAHASGQTRSRLRTPRRDAPRHIALNSDSDCPGSGPYPYQSKKPGRYQHQREKPRNFELRTEPGGNVDPGSGIRCLLTPGSGVGKKSGSDQEPGSYFLELRNNFLG